MISLVLETLLIVAIGFIGYVLDKKDQEKERDQWLREEEQKPRSYVEFTLKNGEVKRTGSFEPYSIDPGSKFNISMSSYQRAARHNQLSFERGFFEDILGNSYPVSNVENSKIVTKRE